MSLSYQLFQVIHMHGSHKIYTNGTETKTKAMLTLKLMMGNVKYPRNNKAFSILANVTVSSIFR